MIEYLPHTRFLQIVYFLCKFYWPLFNPFGHAWNLSWSTETGEEGKASLSLQVKSYRMFFCLYGYFAWRQVHDNAHSGKNCRNTYIWLTEHRISSSFLECVSVTNCAGHQYTFHNMTSHLALYNLHFRATYYLLPDEIPLYMVKVKNMYNRQHFI